MSEGIENRILTAAKTAKPLWAVFDSAKTKRYTHARIRRVVLACVWAFHLLYFVFGVKTLRPEEQDA